MIKLSLFIAVISILITIILALIGFLINAGVRNIKVDAYKDKISALESQLAISNEHKDLLKELNYPKALQIVESQSSLYNDEKKKLLKEIKASKESIESYREKVSSLSSRPSIKEYNDLVVKYHKLVDQFHALVDPRRLHLKEELKKLTINLTLLDRIIGMHVDEQTGFPENVQQCFEQVADKYGITTFNTLENFEIDKRIEVYQDVIDCVVSSQTSEK